LPVNPPVDGGAALFHKARDLVHIQHFGSFVAFDAVKHKHGRLLCFQDAVVVLGTFVFLETWLWVRSEEVALGSCSGTQESAFLVAVAVEPY